APGGAQIETHASGGQLEVGGANIRGIAKAVAVALQVGRQVVQQSRAEGIVAVDNGDAHPRQGKESGLGGTVTGLVAVIVQVVAAEVGEDGAVDARRLNPVLGQAVGGDLHGGRGDAPVAQVRENGLQA